MCGITGWIDWQENMQDQERVVAKMAAKLNRRGPDAVNTYATNRAALGHTRLVVVDPEGGKQPMTRIHQGNPITLVYNGELYNTEDLRKELLKAGYTFQGHSDTEVLLASYLHWGKRAVELLNGIFAFAIWDERKEELFLARDRLGVKPLFYKDYPTGIIFGSELKALLAHGAVEPKVNAEGLAEIFGLGPSRTPGHGIFRGVNELRPGRTLSYSREGLKIDTYWQLVSNPHVDDLEETSARVRALVIDAVKRQLVADVPICTLLSGGLDSSAITAIAAEELRASGRGVLHTYSIDYQDNDQYFQANEFQPNSDGPWIKRVSSTFETEHHNLVITTDQLVQHLQDAVLVRDQPGMADVDSSLLWFCKEIKKQATVALSGECADEIFGGYPWFHREELLQYPGFPWMTSLQQRVSLLRSRWQQRLQLPDYVDFRYQQTLGEVPRLAGESPLESRRRELFYLNMIWFMTTLLDRKDRMSMGASLEVRVPFADHHLVEYVWNIPWHMKMTGDREKGILRHALQGILPDDVLYRKKSPYPKTHSPFYTKAVKSWLESMLAKPAPILEFISQETIDNILDTNGQAITKPWFGQLMTGPQLIAYLAQVNFWLDKYNIQVV